jgi:hypothetical protein
MISTDRNEDRCPKAAARDGFGYVGFGIADLWHDFAVSASLILSIRYR